MVSPRKEKMRIKEFIMETVGMGREARRKTLTSSICLETGFSEKVVKGIIDDLIEVGWIREEDGLLLLTEKGKEEVKKNE